MFIRKRNESQMNTLDYIIKKYNIDPVRSKTSSMSAETSFRTSNGVDPNEKLPIEIPNVGKKDLANWLHELDFKVGVELGVAEGKYSRRLCKANPQMKIYGIDAYQVYGNYIDYSAQTLDSLYEHVKKEFAQYPNYELIKEFSMDAVKKFEDNSLDFVYIDANHEDPYVTEDIVEWSKKVKPGGIVSGHDYTQGRAKDKVRYDVIEAVHKYTKDNNIRPWFVLGLSAKIPGIIRDASRSWFWVKPI